MTKDIAYDFDVGPSINLPGRMTVPKSMRADYFGRNASQPRIVPDTVANGSRWSSARRAYFFGERCACIDLAGGRSFRRYAVNAFATAGSRGSSIGTLVFGRRALSTPACQSRSSNRSARTSAAPRPYVASSNMIAKSRLPGACDREIECKIFCTSFQGKRAWRPFIYAISRCNHPTGKISRQLSCDPQKSEKCPEGTASISNGSLCHPGAEVPHKRIHIVSMSSVQRTSFCARSCLRKPRAVSMIAYQCSFRDAIVNTPILTILVE